MIAKLEMALGTKLRGKSPTHTHTHTHKKKQNKKKQKKTMETRTNLVKSPSTVHHFINSFDI